MSDQRVHRDPAHRTTGCHRRSPEYNAVPVYHPRGFARCSSAHSTCSRSASGRRARTPSGRCAPPAALCTSSPRAPTGADRPRRGRPLRLAGLDRPRPRHRSRDPARAFRRSAGPHRSGPGRAQSPAHPRAADAARSTGRHAIGFREDEHLRFRIDKTLAFHSNGMRFTALDAVARALARKVYFSVGGGFVVDEDEIDQLSRCAADACACPTRSPARRAAAARR